MAGLQLIYSHKQLAIFSSLTKDFELHLSSDNGPSNYIAVSLSKVSDTHCLKISGQLFCSSPVPISFFEYLSCRMEIWQSTA